MYIDGSLMEFADANKSSSPTPGGGSVSAYAGVLGAALTSMVGGLTFGKKAYDQLSQEIKSTLESSQDEVEGLYLELSKIVDEDTNAFDEVVKAYGMPKGTDEEKALRSKAIQEGYKIALEVPLRCAKTCLRVLQLQKDFAEYGNINAISDIGVGTMMAATGCEGALLNVSINLGSLKDQDYKNSITEEVDTILAEARGLRDATMKVVYERLLG